MSTTWGSIQRWNSFTWASTWKQNQQKASPRILMKFYMLSARDPPTRCHTSWPYGWAILEPSWGHRTQRGQAWSERTSAYLPPCLPFTRDPGPEPIFNCGPGEQDPHHHILAALFSTPAATMLQGMLRPCRRVSREKGRRGRAGPEACPILGMVHKTQLSSPSYSLQGDVTTLTSAWGVRLISMGPSNSHGQKGGRTLVPRRVFILEWGPVSQGSESSPLGKGAGREQAKHLDPCQTSWGSWPDFSPKVKTRKMGQSPASPAGSGVAMLR